MTDLSKYAPELAEVLAEHAWSAWLGGCNPPCEWQGDHGTEEQQQHAAHVADALLPVLARVVAEAKAEAWDEGYVAADFAVHRGVANPCAVLDRGNPYRAEATEEAK